MDTREVIAANLRAYLEARYPTQRAAAAKLGLSPAHLSNYLNAREKISQASAEKIKEAHPDISISYLVMGEGTITASPTHNIGSITNSRTVINGDCHASQLALEEENRRLKEELARAAEEKDRLLGIIETLSRK